MNGNILDYLDQFKSLYGLLRDFVSSLGSLLPTSVNVILVFAIAFIGVLSVKRLIL